MSNAMPLDDTANSRSRLAETAYANGADLGARQSLYEWQTPHYDLPSVVSQTLAGTDGIALDAGCGNGKILAPLRNLRPELTIIGLDLSPGIMAGLEPPLLVADAEHLPFRSGSFDAILALHMIYHLRDIAAGIAEFARVLRPEGALVASTNSLTDKKELDELWSRAAADVLGVPEGPRRISLSSRFRLEEATATLATRFTVLHITELPGTITVSEPDPVVAHLASYKAWADQAGVPFDATVKRAAELLQDHIDQHGVYTITCLGGVITGRPRSA